MITTRRWLAAGAAAGAAALAMGLPAPAGAAPTAVVFAQTETFGSVAAGSPATSTYTLTAGPDGTAAQNGAVSIVITNATAADIPSCTVVVNDGPSRPVVVQYRVVEVLGTQTNVAELLVATGLTLEAGSTVTLAVSCETTEAAAPGPHRVDAIYIHGEDPLQILIDSLTITAPVTVPPTTVPPTTDAPTTVPPTTVAPSTPALAATGPD